MFLHPNSYEGILYYSPISTAAQTLACLRAYLRPLHTHPYAALCRDALLAGSMTAQQQQRAKETEATAELDNQGLVQLQQQVMQQQDQELEQMEKTVISTKVHT